MTFRQPPAAASWCLVHLSDPDEGLLGDMIEEYRRRQSPGVLASGGHRHRCLFHTPGLDAQTRDHAGGVYRARRVGRRRARV